MTARQRDIKSLSRSSLSDSSSMWVAVFLRTNCSGVISSKPWASWPRPSSNWLNIASFFTCILQSSFDAWISQCDKSCVIESLSILTFGLIVKIDCRYFKSKPFKLDDAVKVVRDVYLDLFFFSLVWV